MDKELARRRLIAERERLEGVRVAAHSMGEGGATSGTELSHVGQHPADLASDVADRQTAAALETTLDVELQRLEAAFERLERGEYGVCGICGQPIEDERLEVTPAARTCIEHRELDARLGDPARR